jgi:hypothetical protein
LETFEKCHFEERKRLRNPKIPHCIRDMDFSLRSK